MPEHAVAESAPETDSSRPTRPASQRVALGVVIALVIALAAVLVGHLVQARPDTGGPVPQNAAMEAALGVRFSRVAVVGDGGLITVNYVVLDQEKATRFQADREHAPVLYSEARDGSTKRVSLMKQGHNLRAGQTYYLVYENTAGALQPDELVTIRVGDLQLRHVPVL